MLKTAGEQVKRKGCGGDVVQNFHLRENESDFRDNTGRKDSQTYLKFPLTLSLSPGRAGPLGRGDENCERRILSV